MLFHSSYTKPKIISSLPWFYHERFLLQIMIITYLFIFFNNILDDKDYAGKLYRAIKMQKLKLLHRSKTCQLPGLNLYFSIFDLMGGLIYSVLLIFGLKNRYNLIVFKLCDYWERAKTNTLSEIQFVLFSMNVSSNKHGL